MVGTGCNTATSNFQGNIQIVRIQILKYNIPSPVSLITRHLNFETVYCCFGCIFDIVICYIFKNVEDKKKIHFPIQKYVCHSYTLRKIHQHSFSENPVCFSESLGLIHLDLLELTTLFYSKYKQMIIFLDDYSYCSIAFLYKKSEAVEAIKSIFQMWSDTTFHSVKILYTNNEKEY